MMNVTMITMTRNTIIIKCNDLKYNHVNTILEMCVEKIIER